MTMVDNKIMQKPELLYLDLMKKTLSYMLWPEPAKPSQYGFKAEKFSERQRIEGEMWPKYAHTMIGMKRLDNLQYCVETVLNENVEGYLIETGVWRGGACIFMRAILTAYGIDDRRVFVADSFEGLPRPDTEKYSADQGDRLHTFSYLAISQDEVEGNFKKYSLLDKQVVFLKGWFKDTLPQAPIDKLSILRLDGDMIVLLLKLCSLYIRNYPKMVFVLLMIILYQPAK